MGQFPPADLPDWNNLKVIHRNTLPARTSFFNFSTPEKALSYDITQTETTSLNGTWKFLLSENPYTVPEGFEKNEYDHSKWSDIKVPSMWQLEGHGSPAYSNVDYPFPVDPPNVSYHNNPTGNYTREFTISNAKKDEQIRLRFEGVDSAFHCWVNGTEVGYSQGARNPTEFDISDLVKEGANTLSVRVYQWCDGSYIEDQDQWWLSGIFRDVNILHFPKSHIQDFHVKVDLDEKYQDGTLTIDTQLNSQADGEVNFTLYDSSKQNVVQEARSSFKAGQKDIQTILKVSNPLKWTAEEPNLYHLVITYGAQSLASRVGFRKVEIKEGLILVNGQHVIFRGVNRHEHHPSGGRTVPLEFLRQDLYLMKQHNLNAIRTSHQPNDTRLYDLADELGFWVMDEADLECHGLDTIHERSLPLAEQALSFEEKKAITYGRAGKWLSDNKEWKEAYVDRARQMVHRDKNHPSIIMWSLGNEAFYGQNFQSMYDFIKTIDTSRPIHYEGDFQAQTVDMFSMMYPTLEIMEDFAKSFDGKKCLILCEYIHAMGNGPGNIKEYIDLFYKYPCLQGGWAWEWANHGLLSKNEGGEEYYAYGGDFGEFPHDANFVMDGLVDSQHRPGPGLIEYKKAIEPVQLVEATSESVKIINRYDFRTLDHLKCTYSILTDGVRKEGVELDVPKVLPRQTGEVAIPEDVKNLSGEIFLELSFSLKDTTPWSKPGHEVAWFQIPISNSKSQDKQSSSNVEIAKAGNNLMINSSKSDWTFDLINGRLHSWSKNSKQILHTGPELTFFRAPTDNDGADGADWYAKMVNHLESHPRSVKWETPANGPATVTSVQRIAAPTLEWSIDATLTYTFFEDRVEITVKGTPQGLNLPRTLPRIGLQLSLDKSFTDSKWYGRGPGESYKDKKLSQKFGQYASSINELSYEYEFPQESGNHTETRWVEFSSGESSVKASFSGKDDGFDFQAGHYDVYDIEKSKHPYELKKLRKDEVIVRLDYDHHGLGSGSCGPKTLPQYALSTKPFEFTVVLE